MQIKCLSGENFEIKSKNAVISTQPAKVNDFVLDCPGEYEIANIMVEGIQIAENEIIYVFDIEDVRLFNLDGLTRKPNEKELEVLSNVDVLFIPTSDTTAIKPEQIQEYVNLIDPRIIILPDSGNSEALNKIFGNIEKQKILKLSKFNLPEEGRQIIALE